MVEARQADRGRLRQRSGWIKRQREIGREIVDEVAEKIKRIPAPRGKSVRPVLVYDGHLAPIIETEGFFDALISFRSLLGI